MITLPPGCTVNYPIRIFCNTITPEIAEWFELIGGKSGQKGYINYKGQEVSELWVSYSNAKPSSYAQDGTRHARINFNGSDASVAGMFLLKFNDDVVSHNLKDYDSYKF